MIRRVEIKDAEVIASIYNYYILNTDATFVEKVITIKECVDKIKLITSKYPFIVFEENNEVLGYAYGSQFRPESAYNCTVESTVYVKPGVQGKQIGTALYTELISVLKQQEFKSVLGVLTIPNLSSEKLHNKLGFTQVAHLKNVGFKFNKWLDVGVFQLMLN